METVRLPKHPLHLARRSGARCRRGFAPTIGFFSLATLFLAPPFSSAFAQDSGTLRGVVSNPDKKRLPQARVRIVGTELVTLADSDGTFLIAALPSGERRVEVKLLGYEAALMPVQIEPGRTATLRVTLTAVAVPLETVEVTGDTMVAPGMQGFKRRKERGNGKFFSREDIARMQVRLVTDILRRAAGMNVQTVNGSYGAGYSVQSRRAQSISGGRACPVLFYLNGAPFPLNSGIAINNYVSPDDVAAIEVYTGASQIPSEFNSSMYNARCGVVVIWTRYNADPARSR
jgi:hypothetical protein